MIQKKNNNIFLPYHIVAGVELPAYDLCKKLMVQSGFLGDSLGTHFL
jgi:hypothetical protein